MDDTTSATSSEEPNVSAERDWVVERISRRWFQVTVLGVFGAIIACAYTAFRPAEYAGRVSIFFPSKPSVLGSSGLVDSSLGGAAAALSGGTPNSLKVYEAFLASETAIRDICAVTNVKREVFVAKRSLEDDSRSSVLTVTFNDRDRTHGLQVLEAHVHELEKINRKVAFDTSQDDISVLRRRLQDAEAKLKRSEDELVVYERSLVSAPSISSGMGGAITATPESWAAELVRLRLELARVDTALESSKERVRMLANLPRNIPTELPPVKRFQTLLRDAEYQLAIKRLTLGPDAPDIRKFTRSIAVIRKQMEGEIRTYLQGVNSGIIDPSVGEGSLPQLLVQKTTVAAQIEVIGRLAKVAPVESVRLNRRYRELALQGTVVQQLTTQLLQVSLQAQRDPNRWVVLDDPWVEDKPSNKSYLRMGLAGLVIGAIIGCLFALTKRVPGE